MDRQAIPATTIMARREPASIVRIRRYSRKWSVQGSNLRPPGCKPNYSINQSHQIVGLRRGIEHRRRFFLTIMSVFAGTNRPPNRPPNGGTFVDSGLNDAIHRRAECHTRPRAWPVNGDPSHVVVWVTTPPTIGPQNHAAIHGSRVVSKTGRPKNRLCLGR